MDDSSSVGSITSLSSVKTDVSTLKLSQLDLQLLSLAGNSGGVEDDVHLGKGRRYLEEKSTKSASEGPERIKKGDKKAGDDDDDDDDIAVHDLYNKIGRHAYQAVKSKDMKLLHSIKKDKINQTKFHDILLDLGIIDDLTDREIEILDVKYRVPKTSVGIHFDKFRSDFKRLGKMLYEKNMRQKVRWKHTRKKIDLLGGLPDNGVVLEDLSSTLSPLRQIPLSDKFLPNTQLHNSKHITKFTNPYGITESVHNATFGVSPLEKPITAAAAAYSCFYAGIDNSPAISPRDKTGLDNNAETDSKVKRNNNEKHLNTIKEITSFLQALETAAEIDTLRGRRPPPVSQRASVVLTPNTKDATIKIVNRISGHTNGQKVLKARAKKQGAFLWNSLQDSMQVDSWDSLKTIPFSSVQDEDASAHSFVDDPLKRLSTTSSSPNKATLPPIREDHDGRTNSPSKKLDPLLAPRTNPILDSKFLHKVELGQLKEEDDKPIDSDDEKDMEHKRLEEETAMMENEAAAALALIHEEEKREAEREEMEEKKRLESMTAHDKALRLVDAGMYGEGVEKLLELLEIHERNKTIKREKERKSIPKGTPSEHVLIREIAEIYIVMREFASASVLIRNFFTKLRMRTIFIDGSITIEDMKKLLVMCQWQVHLYHLVEARPLLEKTICVCEDLSNYYVTHTESEDYLQARVELYILKLKMLTNLGSYEAAMSICEYISMLISKLLPVTPEELKREKLELETEKLEENERKKQLQQQEYDATHHPKFSTKSIAEKKEEAAQLRKLEKMRLKEKREKNKSRKKRDNERQRKQRTYDKLLILYKEAQSSLLCLKGEFKSSTEACELALERRKALYGKFVEIEVLVENESTVVVSNTYSSSDRPKKTIQEKKKEKKIERTYDESSSAHPEIAHSYHLLGEIMVATSHYDIADEYFTCAIRHNTLTFGEDHVIIAISRLAQIWGKIKKHIDIDSKANSTDVQQMRSELYEILKTFHKCFQQLIQEIKCIDGVSYLCHPSIAHVLYIIGMLEKQSDNVDIAYLTFTKCYEIQQVALRKQSLPYLLCMLENSKHVAYGPMRLTRHYDLYLRSKEGYEHFLKYAGNRHSSTCAMSIQHANFLTTLGYYKESEDILRCIQGLLQEKGLQLSKATEDLLNYEAVVSLGETLVTAGSWTEGLEMLITLVSDNEDVCNTNKDSIVCYKRYQHATLICAKCLNLTCQYSKALSLITKYELIDYPNGSSSTPPSVSTYAVDLLVTKAVSLFGIKRVDEGGDVLQSIHDLCVFSCLARVAQITEVQHQKHDDDPIQVVQKLEVPYSHPTHSYYLLTLAEYQRLIGNLYKASECCEDALSMRLQAYLDIRLKRQHPDICFSLLQCAIAQIEIAVSLEDETKRRILASQVVLAFGEDIVPTFKQSFGSKHVVNLYVKGYYGAAVTILGGIHGEQQINKAINELKMSPYNMSEDHIWITRLKIFLNE